MERERNSGDTLRQDLAEAGVLLKRVAWLAPIGNVLTAILTVGGIMLGMYKYADAHGMRWVTNGELQAMDSKYEAITTATLDRLAQVAAGLDRRDDLDRYMLLNMRALQGGLTDLNEITEYCDLARKLRLTGRGCV